MKEQKIESLQQSQHDLRILVERLSEKQKEFDLVNKGLFNEIDACGIVEEELKGELRIDAEEEFKETGNKKLLGGIGIRILTKLNYEEKDAIDWAGTKMPVALKTVLDKKQFETFAKTNELDFVNKEEKVSVTFPKEIII